MLPFCLHLLLVASVSAVNITTTASVNSTFNSTSGDSGGMSTEHQILTGCGVVVACVFLIFVFDRYTRLGRQFAGKWCIH